LQQAWFECFLDGPLQNVWHFLSINPKSKMGVTAGFSVNIRPIWENDRILFSDTRWGLNQKVTYIIVEFTFSFFVWDGISRLIDFTGHCFIKIFKNFTLAWAQTCINNHLSDTASGEPLVYFHYHFDHVFILLWFWCFELTTTCIIYVKSCFCINKWFCLNTSCMNICAIINGTCHSKILKWQMLF